MNSNDTIAAHLSIGQKVNCWQKRTGFIEFFFTSIRGCLL